MSCLNNMLFQYSRVTHVDIRCLANRSSIVLPDQRTNINEHGLTGRDKEKQ